MTVADVAAAEPISAEPIDVPQIVLAPLMVEAVATEPVLTEPVLTEPILPETVLAEPVLISQPVLAEPVLISEPSVAVVVPSPRAIMEAPRKRQRKLEAVRGGQRFLVEYQVEHVLRAADIRDALRQATALRAGQLIAITRED